MYATQNLELEWQEAILVAYKLWPLGSNMQAGQRLFDVFLHRYPKNDYQEFTGALSNA